MTASIGRDSTEVMVAALWARTLGQPPASLDESFFSAGTSLAAARFVGALRAATGREVPLHVVFDRPTVRGVGSWLREDADRDAGSGASRPAVLTLRSTGAGAPLLLLPGGGGSLVGLGAFADDRFDRPVHGLIAPGLAAGEQPPSSIEQLSAHFAECIDRARIATPVHLLGYCGGGVFAHHLASTLTAAGRQVLSVTMVETSLAAPDLSADEIIAERLTELAAANGLTVDGPLTPHLVFEHLRGNGVDLLEADTDAFERRLRVFAALWRIIADYRPATTGVPTALFSTSERLDDAPDDATDWADLGLPELRQVDVDAATSGITTHPPTLQAVELWLTENEAR